jgi:hypothetical protein
MNRLRVSDHAVLRYLERQIGIDVDLIRAEIAQHVAVGIALGASKVKACGLEFRIIDDTVVTVTKMGGHDIRYGRRPRRGQPREET